MHETDEQLMVRVSLGDKKAFEELFTRYRKKLYNYILRLCRDPAFTEDIFQETFLRLYRHSRHYKPLAKFSTFLYRIATNLSINEMKRRRKFPTFYFGKQKYNHDDAASYYEEDIPSKELSPEDHVYSIELNRHLQQALTLLPHQMRATLILSEIEGKKYDEIADILGCSVGTIKSRVNRSRSKILKYFQENDIL